MKIVKQKSTINQVEAITFRLPKGLLEKLTVTAKRNDISRQRLVTAILEQAISDKTFELKIKE